MKILGIETSCDDTAIAIVDNEKKILANQIFSQTKIHNQFGGVVPEIAARNHLFYIEDVLQATLSEANQKIQDIDAIAVTRGPGLSNSLLVGIGFARVLGLALNKKVIPVNHLEAHLLTARLTDDIEFPFICLLLSGGHSQIIFAKSINEYYLLNNTIDDSIGDTFDKVARYMNLKYPGGPEIEKLASMGDSHRFHFPRSLCHSNNFNFSFSGLKTAVKNTVAKLDVDNWQNVYDVCAAFQKCIVDILSYKLSLAINKVISDFHVKKFNIVAGGGVIANQQLRSAIVDLGKKFDISCFFPNPRLCTDNAAMIAWTAHEMINSNRNIIYQYNPLPKWPIFKD